MKKSYTFSNVTKNSQDEAIDYEKEFYTCVYSALLLSLTEEQILTKQQYERCLKLLERAN